jgi:lipopolysaccharide transport system permease protein
MMTTKLELPMPEVLPEVRGSLPDEAQPAPREPCEIVIQRRSGWQMIDFRELWRYRELLFFLTWRDIKVRYKQAVLGATWAILQPLATMVVFSLFFSRLARGVASDVPYPLFVLNGLIPWLFFSHAISAAGQSIVGGQHLITKIYFPRLLIPLGSVGAGLVDFVISFSLLQIMVLGYWLGGYPVGAGWQFLLVPFLVLGLVATAVGIGTLLAALTVAYRDFRHATPFIIQLWMFATPSIYLYPEALNGTAQAWLPLNPVYGLIANFRAAVTGGPLDFYSLAVSGGVGLVLLLIGCFYFRRVERGFADIL